jgi:lincosamide and streptogramin A transport system ATP-binding/permease protein
MSLINVSNLTFGYDGSSDLVFDNVSFQIDTDWKLGFCGRNGRGKTTFLKLLLGKYAYQGSISSSVVFEYFPFQTDGREQLSTLEVLTYVAPEVLLWQIHKERSLLNVGEDVLYRPFCSLSGGEQTKMLLAGLFLRENSYLLIDEPTDHLDMEAREMVARYLHHKSGFILVSHDRSFLDACTDHTLSINKQNIEMIKGSYSVWWEQKQRRDAYETAQNDKLAKEIGRLESAARQSSAWADKVESTKLGKGAAALRENGHGGKGAMAYHAEQSRRMQQRRKNLEHRQQSGIEEKRKLLKNIENTESLCIHPQTYHTPRLLSLDNVTVAYNGRQVVTDVSFTLERGDRLALTGGNGSGKSSLLKIICGEQIPYAGVAHIGSRLAISYVPQHADDLSGTLDTYAAERQINRTLLMTILRKLDFSRTQFNMDMRYYSEGQKKKVLLACSLCEQAHVYIWDEPLNYIDVLSRIQIEALILASRPTLLFTEHDRMFCDRIATRNINLPHRDRIIPVL